MTLEWANLLQGFTGLTWQAVLMMVVGGVLIWLAINKDYEPLLLLPIGLGCILANIPGTGMLDEGGLLKVLYDAGIENELFPSLVFIGIGAMTDFGPLLENPKFVLFGAAAQFGIFGTLLLATLFGFSINEAASIGIIGAADGPTSIFVASELAPDLVGPITVAAYSYMSLVPVIQVPVMKALTTKRERLIKMPYTEHPISKTTRILFPIVVTLICGVIAPESTALIGMLMFGNLVREAGVVERINQAAQNEIANIVTTFLGHHHRLDHGRRQVCDTPYADDHRHGFVRFYRRHRRWRALWQADVRSVWIQDQPAIRWLWYLGIPHVGPRGAKDRPRRRLYQLFAHARHGIQYLWPDRFGDGRWRCAGAAQLVLANRGNMPRLETTKRCGDHLRSAFCLVSWQ